MSSRTKNMAKLNCTQVKWNSPLANFGKQFLLIAFSFTRNIWWQPSCSSLTLVYHTKSLKVLKFALIFILILCCLSRTSLKFFPSQIIVTLNRKFCNHERPSLAHPQIIHSTRLPKICFFSDICFWIHEISPVSFLSHAIGSSLILRLNNRSHCELQIKECKDDCVLRLAKRW